MKFINFTLSFPEEPAKLDREPNDRRLFGPYACRWAAYGAALSLGAPAGLWVLLKFASQHPDERMRWIYLYCLAGTCFVFASFGLAAGTLMDRLREAATVDPLTGLYNRRFLMDQLPRLRESCIRRDARLALFFIDLDRFKSVNDQHGHPVGDQTLRAIAQALSLQVRRMDLLARYGGEEFVLACLDLDHEQAARLAERLRQTAERLSAEQLGYPGPQTISIGWTLSPPQGRFSCARLMWLADEALYRAKREGRNRVVEAPAEEEESGAPSDKAAGAPSSSLHGGGDQRREDEDDSSALALSPVMEWRPMLEFPSSEEPELLAERSRW
jgi:diguanylate cyclase (GGDEF)-like protein